MFQGRFKAVLVEDESHALELTRYIHLNPVRARIVERPEEYGGSSYRDYLGVRTAAAWLDWQTVLAEVAKERARSSYRRFVEAGLSEPPASPLEAVVGGMFLGRSEWVDRWRRRLAEEPIRQGVPAQRQLAWRPTLDEVVAAVSQAFDVDPADVLHSRRHGNQARLAAIYLSRLASDEAAGRIARHFGGVSAAAISKTVARVEHRRGEDPAWDRRLESLLDRLRATGDAAQRLSVKT